MATATNLSIVDRRSLLADRRTRNVFLSRHRRWRSRRFCEGSTGRITCFVRVRVRSAPRNWKQTEIINQRW